MESRYDRQLLHWGTENQQRLSAATVVVAGVGGLGCTVSQLLVRAGIGRLYLVDDGVVNWPDLNRQLLYGEADIGTKKSALAAARLARINSATEIVPLDQHIDESFVVPAGVDAVADCLDNYRSRFLLDKLTPSGIFLVHGGIQGDFGQVLTLLPGESQPLEEIFTGAVQPAGEIPATPDNVVMIAGLMSHELFSVLFGQPKLLNRCLVLSLVDFHISFLDI